MRLYGLSSDHTVDVNQMVKGSRGFILPFPDSGVWFILFRRRFLFSSFSLRLLVGVSSPRLVFASAFSFPSACLPPFDLGGG